MTKDCENKLKISLYAHLVMKRRKNRQSCFAINPENVTSKANNIDTVLFFDFELN